MRDWYEQLCTRLADGPVVMLTVLTVEGSAPREAGARMLVHRSGRDGSIGGGQLEFQETAAAQDLLMQRHLGEWHREVHRIALGPDAGQCCGGVVEVLHEVFGPAERSALTHVRPGFVRPVKSGLPPMAHDAKASVAAFAVRAVAGECCVDDATEPLSASLFLYGAGHVGRALVPILTALPFAVSWVDVSAERFPLDGTAGATRLITDDPAGVATSAADRGIHLVMTHTHDIDYVICAALLRRDDFRFLGLIGSQTKQARFVQRFRREGIAPSAIARITCPIGDPRIVGKEPAVIAVAVAAQLLQLPFG